MMLYISARNCSRMRSRIGCHRLMPESQAIVPGLRRSGSVREAFPNVYGAGLVNAVVSNHRAMVPPPERFPSFDLSEVQPRPDVPEKLHAPVTEIGVPVWNVRIPVVCQLPRIQLPIPWEKNCLPWPKGNTYT